MVERKTIAVDFDGVIHSYISGWQGKAIISDPPVPGAIEWLRSLLKDGGYKVAIFSSRNDSFMAVPAMRNWLREHGMTYDELRELDFPLHKPPAHLTIDDRAMCFQGTFPTLSDIDNFKPWYKKEMIHEEKEAKAQA